MKVPSWEPSVGNLATFLAFAVILAVARSVEGAGPGGARTGRLVADLLASQLALALVTPWFFALQERLLTLAGARPGLTP